METFPKKAPSVWFSLCWRALQASLHSCMQIKCNSKNCRRPIQVSYVNAFPSECVLLNTSLSPRKRGEGTNFGQSRFGHPDLTNFGQSNLGQSIFGHHGFGPANFGQIQFWPIQFWIWVCVMVGPKRVAQTQKKWGPDGWGSEGWGQTGGALGPRRVAPRWEGPRRVGAQNFALFSLSRPHFRSVSLTLCVFSLNFGVCEGRDSQVCTFGLSGCRVKPRRPLGPADGVRGGGPGQGVRRRGVSSGRNEKMQKNLSI